MIDDFTLDQPVACAIVKQDLQKNNISHAYLIEANNYYRGFDFAVSFAKALLCPSKNTVIKDCGECTQCHRIDTHNFAELEIIEPDGQWIKKEQLDKLQQSFSTKSLEGNRKIYIINHAEKLNTSAANSILKFLEEPEDNITAILVTNSTYSMLDTIISRCQNIKLLDKKNIDDAESTLKQIALYLFNNQEDIDEFNDSSASAELLSNSIKFIKSYEKNGINTILDENKLCGTFLNDKIVFGQLLDIVILFYQDCLNNLIGKKNLIFKDFKDDIHLVSSNNTYTSIIKKIEVLTIIKERLKYNCNLNLVLDKLIISLGGI